MRQVIFARNIEEVAFIAKVGKRSLVTLPKELVSVLNIEPGDYIYIKVQIAKKGCRPRQVLQPPVNTRQKEEAKP
jgi:bifunctional DNA-binding transcriptional regulator/antitoxin component of YhaV-PrlF toxin-antitoxin module